MPLRAHTGGREGKGGGKSLDHTQESSCERQRRLLIRWHHVIYPCTPLQLPLIPLFTCHHLRYIQHSPADQTDLLCQRLRHWFLTEHQRLYCGKYAFTPSPSPLHPDPILPTVPYSIHPRGLLNLNPLWCSTRLPRLHLHSASISLPLYHTRQNFSNWLHWGDSKVLQHCIKPFVSICQHHKIHPKFLSKQCVRPKLKTKNVHP